MKRHSFRSGLLSLMALCSMALTIGSCANDDVAQNPTISNDDKNLATFTAGVPTTRTSMESDGKFYWDVGDKIYVKDDNGVWHASSNSPAGKTDNFKFIVPGIYTAHTSYEVYYPGLGGSNDKPVISADQSQAEPNTTVHFGAAGDCGMAIANKVPGKQRFAFTLDHKATYLLFLPRTSNTILHDCYLTKVEVNSDDDITGTYALDPVTGKLTGTGTGKKITVGLGGSGTYANGFLLTNKTTSAATNGAYMVIKPGTHTLKIRYWVKDLVTGVEGTITKDLPSKNFEQNKYYNITVNLDVTDYDGDHYYMWDAKEQYWKGYEWTNHLAEHIGQPAVNTFDGSPSSVAKDNRDDRYYHEGPRFVRTNYSCAALPNANEMTWYVAKGDPRWDKDGLWSTMGHLYKGGMWFKKKVYIDGYDENVAVDGINWIMDNHNAYKWWYPSETLPDAANISKYFYLPALGYYPGGNLLFLGVVGYYWTSTAAEVPNKAFTLIFSGNRLSVTADYLKDCGMRVAAFK